MKSWLVEFRRTGYRQAEKLSAALVREDRTGRLPHITLVQGLGLAVFVLGSGVVPVVAFAFWAEGPSWILMWTVILALFCAAKVAMWQAFAPKGTSASTFLRYSLGFGMVPRPFTRPGLAFESTTTEEWLVAAGKTLLGVVLIWGGTRLVIHHNHLLAGYAGMVGLFVLLGFGVPHLASIFWRRLGVNVEPIMHNPLLARSLTDFWGRRWNSAFRDVVCPLFCHPLMPKLGRGGALITGFLVSGLVHELVISFPSRGGFGGPTAYFLVQAFGVLIQRRLNTLHLVRHRVILSRISTFAFLTAPLPLLYPPLFVDRVVLPFLRVIGAT